MFAPEGETEGGFDILVGTNTGGFESLGGQLLVLVGDQVHTQREVIDVGLLTSQIEDTDLGVGNTTVEPGLRVGLSFENQVSIHVHPCLVHLFHPSWGKT